MRLVLIFAIVFSLSVALQSQTTSKPDLSKLSIHQLHDCYRDWTFCGTNDRQSIAFELGTRLPQFSTSDLLQCFAKSEICGGDEFSIAEELRKRRRTPMLMERYWEEKNISIRSGIMQVLYPSGRPEIADFMKKVFVENVAANAAQEDTYWPAAYLARKCDPDALDWLAARKERLAGCIFFPETVEQFGKCNYRAAIPYLVTYSLGDVCLNVDDAALRDLRKFFRGGPREFSSLEGAQAYYCKRAKDDGVQVVCR